MSIVKFESNGWIVARHDGAEPWRIECIDLGTRLEYSQPRDIRKLIKRMAESGDLKLSETAGIDEVLMRATVARIEKTGAISGVEHREVTEYWLTRAQALKVAARSETAPADALLDEMIHVFELALDGKLGGQKQLDANIVRALLAEQVEPLRVQLVAVRQQYADIQAENVNLRATITEIRSGSIATATPIELDVIAKLVSDLSALRRRAGNPLWRALHVRQEMSKVAHWGGAPGQRAASLPSVAVPYAKGWLEYEIDRLERGERKAERAAEEARRLAAESRQQRIDFN